MKRLLKTITIILSLILLCSLFTGCNELDEMKAQHAILNEDGNVIFNGSTYLPLETINSNNFNPNTVSETVYVTEEDVPVLLSNLFSDYYGDITADGSVMKLYSSSLRDYPPTIMYFCREDRYDEVSAKAKDEEIVAEVYTYSYGYYDDNGNHASAIYMLTEEEMDAVDRVLNTQVKYRVSFDERLCCAEICQGTRDQVFMYEKANLYLVDGTYWLKDMDGDYVTHEVPEELTALFDKMMEPKLIAQGFLEEDVA
ncbi:MAG: hypothetical protein IJB57_09545 [Clostridia bacterium]|nr:hypothetical protein [Clostridia bacterium]